MCNKLIVSVKYHVTCIVMFLLGSVYDFIYYILYIVIYVLYKMF